MKYNNLDSPIFLFTLIVIAVILNLISSIYFLIIMLSGVLFTAFFVSLKNRRMYSLFFIIIAFLFIEINSGLKPLSLTLLSLFLYIFVTPHIRRNLSFSSINTYIYVILFYLGVLLIWSLSTNINETIIKAIIANIFIDLLFIGAFI
ncbi:hypothetical protein [Arcobacter sp. YIC-80]|uniref:hypothetical protein n=1 Tax=unclassified Arcobacter TaxID=2593671 RepID=UPI00384A4639